MSGASRSEVRDFLRDFKRAALAGQDQTKFEVWSREKNRSALPELGMTERKRDQCLLELQPEDYCAGQLPDDDETRGGHVWIFGKEIHGHLVYIKLKIVLEEPYARAQCLSFHEAKSRLTFPFQE